MSFEFNSLAWNLITFFSNIPQNIQGVFCIFLALVMGHVIADFSLQGTFMANAKNRHHDHSYGFRTKPPVEPWMYILTAHTLIHGAAVWIITGSCALALIEIALHWVIDFIKNEGLIGFNTDQTLHYACKLVYAMIVYANVDWI